MMKFLSALAPTERFVYFENTFGVEAIMDPKYPLSSKYFMRLRGLNISVNTRKQPNSLNEKEKNRLDKMGTELQALANTLHIELA